MCKLLEIIERDAIRVFAVNHRRGESDEIVGFNFSGSSCLGDAHFTVWRSCTAPTYCRAGFQLEIRLATFY